MFVPGAVLPTYGALGSTQGTERDTSFASSTQPSFNGNRMQTNNYIFDGTDINEPLQNTIAYNPAPEAIGQMRIITGNPDAEYGNVNGGEILAVTKSGTNKFHGSVYAFYENQNWQANTWANKDLIPIAPGPTSTRTSSAPPSAAPSSTTNCSSSQTMRASATPPLRQTVISVPSLQNAHRRFL